MFGLKLGEVLGLKGVPGLINTNQNLFQGLTGGLGLGGGGNTFNYSGGAGNLSELLAMTRGNQNTTGYATYSGGGSGLI